MYKKLIYLVSFILVLSAASSVRADLVGHWTLDDGSGTTVADISGNGNDGTIVNNPTWIAGVSGGGSGVPWLGRARWRRGLHRLRQRRQPGHHRSDLHNPLDKT